MWRVSIIAAALLFGYSANAAFWIGQTYTPSALSGAGQLLVGAGGNQDGFSQAADGTYVLKTDTMGGYRYVPGATAPNNVAGSWQTLVTAASMPAPFASTYGWAQGIAAIGIAPSSTYPNSVLYMMWNSYITNFSSGLQYTVYRSGNDGVSWSGTSFGNVNATCENDANGPYPAWGPKIGVDPGNVNHVFISTGNSGLQVSTDGTTFSAISTGQIPKATGDGSSGCNSGPYYPGYGIAWNPANANDVYVSSYGNGVYKSTNGGSTFTGPLTSTNTPSDTGVYYITVDPGNNYLYAIEISGSVQNLWQWNGSAWTKVISGNGGANGNIIGVCVDPNQTNHIIASTYNGNLAESTNGTSFSTLSNGGPSNGVTLSTTNDVGWMSILGPNVNGIACDTTTSNKVYDYGLAGFWVTTPWTTGTLTGSSNVTWNSQSRGIESLTAIHILSTPNYTLPIAASWDFCIHNTSLTTYPTQVYPLENNTLCDAWSIADDATGGTGTVCAAIDQSGYGGFTGQYSGCTTNGTTWSQFPAYPANAFPNGAGEAAIENIAESDANHLLFGTSGNQLNYTTNGGGSWNLVSCSGVTWSNFLPGNAFGGDWNGQAMAADRVTAGQYEIYVGSTGFFKLTNNGATCTAGDQITSLPGGGASFNGNMQIKAVPGQSGHFWVTVGSSGEPGIPSNDVAGLGYSTDGGTTINSVTNISQAFAVGLGKSAPGQSYPAVYTGGYLTESCSVCASPGTGNQTFTIPTGLSLLNGAPVTASGSGTIMLGNITSYNPLNGQIVVNVNTSTGSSAPSVLQFYGIWQCTVSCETSTPNWTQMAGYPNGNIDTLTDIDGDKNVYNRVYISLTSSGWVRLNYLLKRDIDPASNDNSPVGLAKVG